MRTMIWFRRDLRVADNPALFHACEASDNGVLAVFAMTSRQWQQHCDAPGKVLFWLQNLAMLRTTLRELKIPLRLIRENTYADVPNRLVGLAKEHQCDALFFNEEYEVNETRRDALVSDAAESAGLTVHRFHDRVIVPPKEIKTKEGRFYTVFTPYRRVWDTKIDAVDPPLPKPGPQADTGIESDSVPESIEGFEFANARTDLWKPGEQEAARRLDSFKRRLPAYDTKRDIPSVNGTSVLSPYLAAGILSPRQCLKAALQSCGGDLSQSKGATTWVSELTWRDFYHAVTVGFPRVSMHQPFNPKTKAIQWREDESDFQAWCQGRTGYPIVDAGMRQLNRTGWMHNRLRMVTAMFLTKHLLIDWRWGERYFMSQLIDGDLAANNGGWQWSASTGTDSVPYFRIFNPFSQSKRFDSEGVFIKKFCPELDAVPSTALHDLKKLQKAISDQDVDYPEFIVDYTQGRQRALAEFKRAGES